MRIMIVDDDRQSIDILTGFLSSIGHKVSYAYNGKDAYESLEKENPDLVIADIVMPKMNGRELLTKIRTSPKSKHIEVIMITAFGDVKSAVNCMKDGAYDYLIKPVNINELTLMIDRIDEVRKLRMKNETLSRKFEEKINEATTGLKKEIEDLRSAFTGNVGLKSIVKESYAMKEVYNLAEKLHNDRSIPVLIEGETGTGKEIMAKYIHYADGDTTTTFIAVNCAAIPSSLFETELFGHEAGSYTGANPKGQKGKFELAENGTIFFDEIGELTVENQAKLLRVIQEGEFYRVGGVNKIKTDVRIICATNVDIKIALKEGRFRRDLFFRFSTGYIKIPPLRERKEDIIPLANEFLKELRNDKRTDIQEIDKKTQKLLQNFYWAGNVRELKNVLEKASLLTHKPLLEVHDLDFIQSTPNKQSNNDRKYKSFVPELPENNFDFEKWNLEIIHKALEKHKWNKSKTAKYLGITRPTLYSYIKKIEDMDI